MKPVALEFCGINSFSEKARIDFKALLSGGVFGIFGDTGSGKSTILDSIHFALYGEIDRVPKSFNDCINYKSDGAWVQFDFEITTDGVRRTYRVKRERKRKNGTTKAYLYEFTDDGALLALAEGTREVDERIERIIGLSYADFKTCIALPQGDFAALVKSTTAERVKLVARLFNLEKYGERLSKAVNERYYRAEEEVNLVKARMGENEGASDELLAQTQAEIAAAEKELAARKAEQERAEEAYRRAETLAKEKREYDALVYRLRELNAQRPQMQETQRRLERLPKAQTVAERAETLANAEKERATALVNAANAKAAYEKTTASYNERKTALQNAGYEETLLKLSVDLQKVQESEAALSAERQAKKELDECRAKFKEIAKLCPKDDFAGKRAALEEEISSLGEDDTLLGYLKHNCKEVLAAEVYGEIRTDLRALREKYPQTDGDIETLLQKYTPKTTGTGQNFDFAAVNLAFKEIERKKKTLRERLQELEKAEREYAANEERKKLLCEQGTLLAQNHQTALEKVQAVKALGTKEELTNKLNACKAEQSAAQKAVEQAQTSSGEHNAQMQKWQGLAAVHEKAVAEAARALQESLANSGFAEPQEAKELLASVGNAERAKAECTAFFEALASVQGQYEKAARQSFENFDEEALARAAEAKRVAQAAYAESNRKLGAKETEKARLLALREKYAELQKELAVKEERRKLCDELRNLVKSNRFLEFIASEYLQEICASASITLLSLTSGRYFLRYDKEFKVGDNLDGGNVRGVKTLSGGETFLVSLSLALSLSSAICLKSLRPIEFFFLDEGFGTLDEKLIDTVMDVLGKLGKSFAVGLISHVEELKHRIESKILVTGANERHGSQIRVEHV